MTDTVNYAELQRQIDAGTLTLNQARRLGSTARAYGWACTPYGHWSDELKVAYREGWSRQD